MVSGAGFGNFDLQKLEQMTGSFGLGGFTGSQGTSIDTSIFEGNTSPQNTGDSFDFSSGTSAMGGMYFMSGLGNMSGRSGMGGMNFMSGMGNMSGMSGMGGMNFMSGMGNMSGMSGMGGMNFMSGMGDMSGMSGMGNMSSMITGFIDLIINFFEGLKNLFGGSSEDGATNEYATANEGTQSPDEYWNEQATKTNEALNSINEEENIKNSTKEDEEGILAGKEDELKSFLNEFGAAEIEKDATSAEIASTNATALENLYTAANSPSAIQQHVGFDEEGNEIELSASEIAEISSAIKAYIEKVAPDTGNVSLDGEDKNNFMYLEDGSLNPEYE